MSVHLSYQHGSGSIALGGRAEGERRLIAAAVEAGTEALPQGTTPRTALRVPEHLRRLAEAACAAAERGHALSGDDYDAAHVLAQQWAAEDVPLATLLQAYRAVEATLWNGLCRQGPPEQQLAACRIVADYFDAVARVATTCYLAARADAQPQRDADDWIARLVTGERPHESELGDLARFGLGRDATVVAFVIEVDDTALDGAITAMSDPAAARGRRLVGRLHGRCVGLTTGIEPGALLNAPGLDAIEEARVGISTRKGSLADIPQAYAEARRSLRMTTRDRPRRTFDGANLFDDLLGLADRTTHRLLPSWAPALDAEDQRSGGELSTTLRTYVDEDFNVARAARRLGIHPNTVRYRLHRIEHLTARSTKSFHGLFEMLAALTLLRT